MNQILIPVIIVSVIGLILGIGLAVSSKLFAVPVNEKQLKIRECLPGVNCGACGFSGCDGYAAALAEGTTTETARCVPGGAEASKAIAAVLGVKAEKASRKTAVVLCQGNQSNVGTKLNYVGADSCRMAVQLFGGPKDCVYGCLGMGDCIDVCQYNALFICDGVARVNPEACKACGMCVKTCPRGLIEILPYDRQFAYVFCKNKDKGVETRKNCKQGCLACTKCVRVCPEGAVSITDNHAVIDINKCIGCGKCEEDCPTGAINVIRNKA
ncbi:MAG: RnfABCDGE type electron transport complex subunit B [Lachnospiraceae bacterium]|nr:RnfABCDGE type electron transport complex subunit B [Lachnospiraceae bacterium]